MLFLENKIRNQNIVQMGQSIGYQSEMKFDKNDTM